MSEKNLSQEVLETIKDNNIKPKPRWEFLFKNYFIWVVGVVSLFIGGMAMAVVIYMVTNNDWDIRGSISDSLLGFIFTTLPYFWLVLMALFILLVQYNIRHTKGGYKYRLSTMVVGIIIASILLGVIFHVTGVGRAIDEIFTERVPLYQKMFDPRKKIWSQAEEGMLAGVVIVVEDLDHFQIKDLDHKIWFVNAEKFFPKQEVPLPVGAKVRMIGNKIDDDIFEAIIVAPFEGKRGSWMRIDYNMDEGKINFCEKCEIKMF